MSSNEFTGRLARTRIIIVEDSFPIANSLKFLLQTIECDVVGMAGNVQAGLDLVTTVPFDVALLDIDLRGEHVAPVAEAVQHQGKPVILLSGYADAAVLPAHLRGLPRLEKPVDATELFAVIDRALTSTPID